MKIAVIIPARYESTRFPGKPLALYKGKPMIQQVYERVSLSDVVTDVTVATDDQRIFDAVRGFGGNAVITGKENRSGTDRVAEAAEKMGLALDDIVVNIQGDQPEVHPQHLQDVVDPFKTEPGTKMSTLAFKIVKAGEITDPKDCKVTFDNRGYALYFSRSPIPYARDAGTIFDTYKHLGIYAYTKRFLDTFRSLSEGRLEAIEKLEQLRAIEYGYQIKVIITEYDSPEVDLPGDISRIEKLD
ncbi:MAG: 3-deoxy-manno-octulosonate cytidylyltransferase [Desulfobacterales bacterium]|jgi:3-deoxy-manno-octulosonate cytidylyltransferase (CMP-KDO synthetase)|nr:3-deoxy-manno-octulosonate cytidylyltransferase [Desulfobacterales bacterium]